MRVSVLLNKVKLAVMTFERIYPGDRPAFLLSLKRAIAKEERRQRDRSH